MIVLSAVNYCCKALRLKCGRAPEYASWYLATKEVDDVGGILRQIQEKCYTVLVPLKLHFKVLMIIK